MANISVDTKALISRSTEIADYKERVRSSSQSISSVSKALSANGDDSFASICKNLDRISDSVLTEAAKMDSLSKALQHIARTYSDTEKNITGAFRGKRISPEDDASGKSGKDKNFFQRIIDWIKKIFGWDPEQEHPTPEAVTREQEKAHDLYMQEEIFNLLDTDKYNKATWYSASIEERKEILKAFLAELAAIYGVTVSSEIDFYNGKSGSRGAYSHDYKLVRINENYLSRRDGYQIMQTMIHEMRHAYQHAAVDDPDSYQVSRETIDHWKENFKPENYKSEKKGDTYEEYVSQPVEYDAKNFAKQYQDLTNANPEYTGSWD